MKRVGIPAHVPCAVQQWEGLIAGEHFSSPCMLSDMCKMVSETCPHCTSLEPAPFLFCRTVTQHFKGGLAAVNYPARAAGITRHMRRAEAKAKCPELQCVHVETIGEFGPMFVYVTEKYLISGVTFSDSQHYD